MNILPNKSWHVWNRKNRERVERDEAEHKQKLEEEHRARVEAARQERYSVLRKKAGVDRDTETSVSDMGSEGRETETAKEHVNLFMDEERTASMRKGHDARAKRKAKEKRSVPEGAMELGQSSAERMKHRPWYWGSQGNARDEQSAHVSRRKETRKRKRLEEDDPLAQMKKYVKQKKTHERERRRELSSVLEEEPHRRRPQRRRR